ncbi:MAG: hypothetical protein LBF61_07345 [Azoarcus sp.]|nr:hypothetical protein [Azoarcus sp.]
MNALAAACPVLPLLPAPSPTESAMERFFNNAGPIQPENHYHIDPLTRLDWAEVQQLIAGQRYFVLHAPRQTGKTSTLLAMMATLNEEGRYACAYANIEAAQAARGDATRGIPAASQAVASSLARYLASPAADWYRQEGRGFSPENQLFCCWNTGPAFLRALLCSFSTKSTHWWVTR